MSQVLLERYRCPKQFVATRPISSLPGNAVQHHCHSSSADPLAIGQNGVLLDWIEDISGDLLHSFDPTEAIEHLRWERYLRSNESGAGAASLAKRLYYLIRPLLPVHLRRQMQRLYFRNWEKIRFPKWPVDATVEEILEHRLLLLMKATAVQIPFIWFWPDDATSAAVMTHDVETTSGRDFCGRLMDINDSFALPAAFQIVPEERYTVTPAFLNDIRSRGNEINVQDLNHDGRLFHDRAAFESRVKQINRYGALFGAKGFRSAVLYRNLDWFDQLEFEYDMSVPNTGHLEAQRGGCCTVFPYFIGNILELPVTTVQDYTLFHVFRTYNLDLWKTQASLVANKHGLLSFIAHPDYLQDSRARDTYRRLLAFLDHCRWEQGMWITTPGEINRWWRQRSQLKLISHHGTWRIDGPGSERARIAYATLRGNSLVYSRSVNSVPGPI